MGIVDSCVSGRLVARVCPAFTSHAHLALIYTRRLHDRVIAVFGMAGVFCIYARKVFMFKRRGVGPGVWVLGSGERSALA